MINSITLIGNLATDPELKDVGETQMCRFRLATNEYIGKNPDGTKKELAQFHTVEVWGNQAVSCKNILEKGKRAYVIGSLRNEEYINKDGQPVRAYKVRANDVKFL